MFNYAKMRILNPSVYYNSPDLVLNDGKLNRSEKEKVLRSMASDARLMAESTIECTQGGDQAYCANDLQAILIQLEKFKERKAIDNQSLPVARF